MTEDIIVNCTANTSFVWTGHVLPAHLVVLVTPRVLWTIAEEASQYIYVAG